MLRFGPETGPMVIAALPLFEEANRTRTFIVTVLRALADRGVAGILPDLPGTGDSLIATHAASIVAMRDAYRAVAEQTRHPVYAFGVRSAALFDNVAQLMGRYHLAPQAGPQLLRELKRIRRSDRTMPKGDGWILADAPIEIACNLVSPALLRDLADAFPIEAGARVARLATDGQPADITFDAAPMWRRAEPGNDPALAALIADDVAAWIAICEA